MGGVREENRIMDVAVNPQVFQQDRQDRRRAAPKVQRVFAGPENLPDRGQGLLQEPHIARVLGPVGVQAIAFGLILGRQMECRVRMDEEAAPALPIGPKVRPPDRDQPRGPTTQRTPEQNVRGGHRQIH